MGFDGGEYECSKCINIYNQPFHHPVPWGLGWGGSKSAAGVERKCGPPEQKTVFKGSSHLKPELQGSESQKSKGAGVPGFARPTKQDSETWHSAKLPGVWDIPRTACVP
jgi:hypothetical protein